MTIEETEHANVSLPQAHETQYHVLEGEEKESQENRLSESTWWEALGFAENPCDIRATDYVFGLDNQIRITNNHIRGGNISCIHGKTGTGKTSTIRFLSKSLQKDGYASIVVDGKRYAGIQGIDVRQEFLETKRGFLSFFKKPKPKILFIDEFQSLARTLTEQIEAAFNDKALYALVCAQLSDQLHNVSASFMNRIGNRLVQTQKIDEGNCRKLVQRRFGSRKLFTEDALRVIIQESEYIPRAILEMIDRILHQLYDQRNLNPDTQISKEKITHLMGKGMVAAVTLTEEESSPAMEHLQIPLAYRLNQTQKEIVEALYRGPKNYQQLREAIGRSEGSIRGNITLLKKYPIIRKQKERGQPAILMLSHEFRQELARD
jgi:hypothetical protein